MYQVLFEERCKQEEVKQDKITSIVECTSQWRETRP